MTGRPTITAAIIAIDEQENLARLLPRLAWADEIVVVDGGSSDGTLDVARRHGCRVVSRPFDTFAQQRNHALRSASGEWVFSIDADERPTHGLVDEIRRQVACGRCTAYRVPVRSTIFGRRVRRSGTQDDQPVRLFRRDAARWTGAVHEVLSVEGRIGRLRYWLEHVTLPDLTAFVGKVERYTSLEAAARVARGQKPNWHQPWLAPPREVFRRLVWKQGLFDGPAGWAFCLLSGWSEWVLAWKHRRQWRATTVDGDCPDFRGRAPSRSDGRRENGTVPLGTHCERLRRAEAAHA